MKSIELTQKAYLNRVEYATSRMETIAGEPLDDIIIEDLINDEGVRVYLNIIGFTETFIVVVDDFITENQVGVFPFERNMRSLYVDTTDYEFSNPTTTSRILVEFTIEPDDEWSLQGTRENCEVIWATVLTRLRPKLSGPPSDG